MAGNGVLYGIIGALGGVVIAGGAYIAQQQGGFGIPAPSSTAPAPVTASPAVPPTVNPPAPAPRPPLTTVPATPSAAEQQLRQLVIDARRAITRGEYNAADRALDQAERIDPNNPEIAAARRDLRQAQQQTTRDDRRVDALMMQARAAIARHDYRTADRLLDQAKNIDSRDRQVQQARSELTDAQRADRPGPRPDRPDRRQQ